MKITIITPIYNTPIDTFSNTINSIRRASKKTKLQLEHIIIDDAVINTFKKLKVINYLPNTIFIRNKKNMGQSFSRNRGIKAATGDYIFFLDSDDQISDNFFKEIEKKIDNHDIIGFPIKKYNGVGFINEYSKIKIKNNVIYGDTMLCNKIFKRLFLKNNKINFPDNNLPFEDDYFILSCFLKCQSYLSIDTIEYKYMYFIGNKSVSSVDDKTKYKNRFKQLNLFFSRNEINTNNIFFEKIIENSNHLSKDFIKYSFLIDKVDKKNLIKLYKKNINIFPFGKWEVLILKSNILFVINELLCKCKWLSKKLTTNIIKKVINFKLIKFLINKSPKFIFKKISSIIGNKYYPSNLKINIKNSESKKNLLVIDHWCALGDFIAFLRLLIKIKEENIKNIDILANIKHRKIIEYFNLNNFFKIIYKKNSLGSHTLPNYKKTYDVYNEGKRIKIDYNLVFFPSRSLYPDISLFLMNSKYNSLIMLNEKPKRNYRWITYDNNILSFFIYANVDRFKIKEFKDRKTKKRYFSDTAYKLIFNKDPIISLKNIKVNLQSNEKNQVAVMISNFPRGKQLKFEYIKNILEERYPNKKVCLFGDNISFYNYLIKNSNIKIQSYIDKTPDVLTLFKKINQCKHILAFDTSILHIGAILNKEILLIVNKKSPVYKNMYNVWMDYKETNNIKTLVLGNKYFDNKIYQKEKNE